MFLNVLKNNFASFFAFRDFYAYKVVMAFYLCIADTVYPRNEVSLFYASPYF